MQTNLNNNCSVMRFAQWQQEMVFALQLQIQKLTSPILVPDNSAYHIAFDYYQCKISLGKFATSDQILNKSKGTK